MVRLRVLLAWFVCSVALPVAMYGQGARTIAQPPPPGYIPQGFEALAQGAAFHTDFTFDRAMLQLAGNFVDGGDPQTRSAIGKLNSITVHSYHFGSSGLYDPSALDLVRRQYEAAGWKHLVAAHAKGDPYNSGQTDLWINFAHMDVTGMMILISGSRDLNLIAVNGDLSTVDLLHLRGHFGIPRFSGDGFAPPPPQGPRQPYVAPPPQESAPPPGQYPGGTGVGVGGDDSGVEAAPPPPTPPGF